MKIENVNAFQVILENNPIQLSCNILKLLQSHGTSVSLKTASSVFSMAGFTYTKTSQMIGDSNRLMRLEFCNNLIDTNDGIEDVIFTDESSVQLTE